MPPARNRATQEDSKAEGINNVKERGNGGPTGKAKKAAASAQAANNRDATGAINSAVNNTSHSGNASIDWPNEDISLLLKYRYASRLETPTAFTSQEHAAVLTVPGIGRHSPSMVRKKTKKIVPKEQLAVVVRRHFHGLPMNEQEVIGDLIYTVKNQDKVFKMRFTPT